MFSDKMQQGDQVKVVLNCGFCGALATEGHQCATTAGRPLQEPYSYFTEQVVLNGETFGSQIIVTVRLAKRGGLYKGDAERVVWRAGWAIAQALDDNRKRELGITVTSTGPDWYVLDENASTIGNEPSPPVRLEIGEKQKCEKQTEENQPEQPKSET